MFEFDIFLFMNTTKVTEILNSIMEFELAGVVRYTHSSLMVTGPHRLPIVDFLKDQANAVSYTHLTLPTILLV